MNTRAEASWAQPKEIDRSILIGIGLSSALVAAGIAWGGGLLRFLHIPSFLLVAGGTLGATIVNFSSRDLRYAWSELKRIARTSSPEALERIRYLVRLSQAIRTHGQMILEQESAVQEDPFMRMALELTVDGQPIEDLKRILETERRTSHEQAARAVQVYETMGTFSPAFGLIGTLIGLIQMLGSLDDPSSVGPAMALALVTTLYGALMSNLLMLPLAGKLRNRSEEESRIKSLTIEGMVSLSRQENPIIVEQRLQSFLPSV